MPIHWLFERSRKPQVLSDRDRFSHHDMVLALRQLVAGADKVVIPIGGDSMARELNELADQLGGPQNILIVDDFGKDRTWSLIDPSLRAPKNECPYTHAHTKHWCGYEGCRDR